MSSLQDRRESAAPVRPATAPRRRARRRALPGPAPEGYPAKARAEKRVWTNPLESRGFRRGVLACATMMGGALLIGEISLTAGFDPSLFVALLPLIYVPMLLGGVGWLVWASRADQRRKH